MLSKEQKEKLRNIHIYELACEEKNGIAIIRKSVPKVKRGKETFSTVEEEFVVPSPYQIAESVFKQILVCGFSKVERVSPTDANCIIRVFQKLHHAYEFDQIFNMYGADCFVKSCIDWISECNGDAFPLDYSKCLIGQWLYQDEKITFDAEFVDFYVKVS